jgi:hypothetical protein
MLKCIKFNFFFLRSQTDKLKVIKNFKLIFLNILDYIVQFIFTDQS